MAENTSTFTGAAADGTALTAVYLTCLLYTSDAADE